MICFNQLRETIMKTKYTVEKILYLDSQDKPLNVDIREKQGTDLSDRVSKLLSTGHIELLEQDDRDKYYRTTKKGKIKLLRLQIEWRKTHGKATDLHELELEELLEE